MLCFIYNLLSSKVMCFVMEVKSPLGLVLNSNEVKTVPIYSPAGHKGFSVLFPCSNFFPVFLQKFVFFSIKL